MNFLPAVLLYLNFNPSDALYTTHYFFNKLEFTEIYRDDFRKCNELVQKTKDLLSNYDLEVYLGREDILEALLIKWFSTFFCTILSHEEVSLIISMIS